MPKCEYCGKEVELPFKCNFCGNYFCLEHRLPENHNCPDAPPRTPLGSYKTKLLLSWHARKKKVNRCIGSVVKTYDNIFGYRFDVPIEVYSDEKYREKLDKARTLDEVEHIIRDYQKHHKKS